MMPLGRHDGSAPNMAGAESRRRIRCVSLVEDPAEIIRAGGELLKLANVVESQRKYEEASSLYYSAKERFTTLLSKSSEVNNQKLANEKIEYCQTKINFLNEKKIVELQGKVESTHKDAIMAEENKDYVQAISLLIEVVDFLMELSLMTTDEEESYSINARMNALLNKAEELKLISAEAEGKLQIEGKILSPSLSLTRSRDKSPLSRTPSHQQSIDDPFDELANAFGNESDKKGNSSASGSLKRNLGRRSNGPSAHPSFRKAPSNLSPSSSVTRGDHRYVSESDTVSEENEPLRRKSSSNVSSFSHYDNKEVFEDDDVLSQLQSICEARPPSIDLSPLLLPPQGTPPVGVNANAGDSIGSHTRLREISEVIFSPPVPNALPSVNLIEVEEEDEGEEDGEEREERDIVSRRLSRDISARSSSKSASNSTDGLENTLRTMTEDAFQSFASSTELKIVDNEAVLSLSNPVKKSILQLVGYTLPNVADGCALSIISIHSKLLELNLALRQSLSTGLASLSSLTRLELFDSEINPSGCEALCKQLSKTTNIIYFSLENNPLGDDGAAHVAQHLLMSENSIRQLVLSGCGIGPEGGKSIHDALESGVSLFELDLRNNLVGCEIVDLFVRGNPWLVIQFGARHELSGTPSCKGHPTCSHVQLSQYRGRNSNASVSTEPVHEETHRRTSTMKQKLKRTFTRRTSHAVQSSDPTKAREGVFEGWEIVPANDLEREYTSALKMAASKVSTPNVLVVGHQGAGKSTLVGTVLGYPIEDSDLPSSSTPNESEQGLSVPVAARPRQGSLSHSTNSSSTSSSTIPSTSLTVGALRVFPSSVNMAPRVRHYTSGEHNINIWDAKGVDPNEGNDENIKRLLEQMNTDEDISRHIHVVWYVLGKSKWRTADENYCVSLLSVALTYKVPVICLINKADEMTADEVDKLTQNIFRASHGKTNLRGVFTSIGTPDALRARIHQTLSGQVPDHLLGKMITHRVKEELATHHQLDSVLQLTQGLLQDTAKDSVLIAQQVSLRNKEVLAADVIRDFKSKMEANKFSLKSVLGNSKKQMYSQMGKVIRKLAHTWGFLKSPGNDNTDENVGKEFFLLIDDLAAAKNASLNVVGLCVHWSVHLKLFLLECLESAAGKMASHEMPDPLSFIFEKIKTQRAVLGACLAMVTKQHEEDTSRAKDSNAGAPPSSVMILRLFVQIEQTLNGTTTPLVEQEEPEQTCVVKKAESLFDQMINLIIDPKTDSDTRDGFFCSYRLSVKKQPIDVLHALTSRFREHSKLSHKPYNSSVCKQIFGCLIFWVNNYFEYDYMENESLDNFDENAFDPTTWVNRGYEYVALLLDFGEISPMVRTVFDFVDEVKGTSLGYLGEELSDVLRDAILRHVDSSRVEEPIFNIQAFKPLAQYDAQLIAAHLTFVDFSYFKSMSARDFFTADSPKRLAMINQANYVSYWVAKSIIEEESIEKRSLFLRKLIEVAAALQDSSLKNFHGFMAVMTGLQFSFVSRLKKTWNTVRESLPQLIELYEKDLAVLASPGNGIYANVLDRVSGPNAVSPPCVPFLGSFLTALERAKVSQGNKSKATDDIAEAARIQGDVVAAQQKLLRRIPTLQKGTYDWESFNLVPRFDEFLRTELPTMFDLSSRKTRDFVEDDLSKKSLICEPRIPTNLDTADSTI